MATNSRGRVIERDGPWGFVFLLAYIGAAIYFIGESNGTFWAVILGLLQAIVWPVYVVFHVLQLIGLPRETTESSGRRSDATPPLSSRVTRRGCRWLVASPT